jgi:hypothetical protein
LTYKSYAKTAAEKKAKTAATKAAKAAEEAMVKSLVARGKPKHIAKAIVAKYKRQAMRAPYRGPGWAAEQEKKSLESLEMARFA